MHLGLVIDEELTCNHDNIYNLSTVNKLTNTLGGNLFYYVPRDSLVAIYKSFTRPHQDLAGVMFDKPNNKIFSNRVESAHYNAALE